MDKQNEIYDRMVKRVFGPNAVLAGSMGTPAEPGDVRILFNRHVIGSGATFAEALSAAQTVAASRWRPPLPATTVTQVM